MSVRYEEYSELGFSKPTSSIRIWLEDMSRVLGRDIKFCCMGGIAVADRLDKDAEFDGIVVYDHSTALDPSQTTGPQPCDSIYFTPKDSNGNYDSSKNKEVYLQNTPYMCEPSRSSDVEIIKTSPYEGHVRTIVGAYKHNTIWINTILANFSIAQTRPWLKDALVKCANDEFWNNRNEFLQKDLEKNFLKRIETAAKNEADLHKMTIAQCDDKIAAYHSNIVILHRKREQSKIRLEYINDQIEKESGYYKNQLKEIIGNSRVENVIWDEANDALSILTDMIYLYDPMRIERAPLGKFQIKFHQSGQITFWNTDRKRGGKMSPHIEGRAGRPCWGASQEAVTKLAATAEYASLLEICIAYLEQYNPNDDMAGSGAYWFTEEETEVKNKKGEWVLKTSLSEKEIQEALTVDKIEGEDELPDDDVLVESELEVG